MILDYATAHAAAQRAVVAMGPDFRYSTSDGYCAYVRADDPRFPLQLGIPASGADKTPCLVGRILDDVGLLTDEIAGSATGILDLIKHRKLDTDERTQWFLYELQSAQDTGSTWGQALGLAEKRAARPWAS